MSDTSSFKLIIEDDEGRRSIVPIDLGRVSIGRLASNVVRLDARNVSREHARLSRESGTVFAEDLDSYNGVWVNGDRIQGRHEIREGDLIRIGDFHLELRGEGLQRRSEETTQKTAMAGVEATQPRIELPPAGAPGAAEPAPAAARDAPRPSAQPVEPDAEATAIIRLDAPELNAPRGQTAAIAGQKAKLVCVSTPLAGIEVEIGNTEMVIGRTPDNDIVLDHRSVSRHHARIVVTGRRFVLHDLGSANGTLVNGEPYAQTELARGDLVELGHVRLRFVPPGETYALTPEELAAVRRPVAACEEPTVPLARRAPLGMVLGAATAAVALVVLAVVLVVRSGDEAPAGAPAVAGAPRAGGAEALLGRAHVALAQRQWDQAVALGNQALSAEPSSTAARELVDRATSERRAQASYEDAQRAVESGDWAAAWRGLQALPAGSVYAEQSKALVERVQTALVADLVSRGRAALAAQDLDAAAARAGEIAAVDPAGPEAGQLRADVERARAARRPAAPTRDKAARAPAPARAAAKQGAPVAGTGPAAPPADAKAAYAEAVASLKSGEIPAAIEALGRCVQADPAMAACYRALGIAHARAGNGPKAAKYYKQYLKVDPSAPDADKVRQLLEQYETAP